MPRTAAPTLVSLLEEAYRVRASDIHVEPIDVHIRVRLRIDGMLVMYEPLPRAVHPELIARIKILAGLLTDEHQRPQDGRFRHELAGGACLDVRVATTPTYYGEGAVLRILFPLEGASTLSELGFSDEHEAEIHRTISLPHGLILATGPTGSGKTSTLYALTRLLASDDRSLITIEDPIEYAMSAVTQIQTNERVGLTFDRGLRSILRQDPDTIMVGEIRDAETARLAVNAALTGHMVLSSLHTNDAATAIPRLLDLSVEPYLLPSTLRLVIAQRLVRRVCKGCSRERSLDSAEQELARAWSRQEDIEPFASERCGTGCAACSHTGYRGRIGVFELLRVDDELRTLLSARPSALAVRTLIRRQGVRSLAHDGLTKVRAGVTTLKEVARLLYE